MDNIFNSKSHTGKLENLYIAAAARMASKKAKIDESVEGLYFFTVATLSLPESFFKGLFDILKLPNSINPNPSTKPEYIVNWLTPEIEFANIVQAKPIYAITMPCTYFVTCSNSLTRQQLPQG